MDLKQQVYCYVNERILNVDQFLYAKSTDPSKHAQTVQYANDVIIDVDGVCECVCCLNVTKSIVN